MRNYYNPRETVGREEDMSKKSDVRMIMMANEKFYTSIKKWQEFDEWLLGTIRPLYKTEEEYTNFVVMLERESARVYLGGE